MIIMPDAFEPLRNRLYEICQRLDDDERAYFLPLIDKFSGSTSEFQRIMRDLGKFGELLNKGWKIKKQYASGITNTRIDRVSKKAFDSGAISLKVTGAGGGGHLFVYAEPKKHKNLESNLKKLGVNRVHFSYHNAGATVFNINNL